MKFFQKPSIPLLLIGIGMLLFVLGLVAVSSLTEKTDAELIDGYFQNVNLNQVEPKTLIASAGQKVNLQFEGKRSVGGLFTGENLVLTLREPETQTSLLQVSDFNFIDWHEENLPTTNQTNLVVIPLTFKLPVNLQVGTKIEGELTGVVKYPLVQENSVVEEQTQINKKIVLNVVSQEELLKEVRQRPIWTMALSFPLSMVLMLLGIRTELYGRKSRAKT